MSGSDRPKTANERALEQIRAGRPALRASVESVRPEDAARIMAEAAARAKAEAPPAPSPIAAKQPMAAMIASGVISRFRAVNSKIWEVDHHKSYVGRKVDTGPWLGAVRRMIREKRGKGDVTEPTLYGLATRIAHYTRIGRGCAQVTHVTLAFEMGICVEGVRRFARWMEDCGLMVTQNTMQTIGNLMMRGPNRYYIRTPDEAAPKSPPAPAAVPPDAPAADAPAVELTRLRRMQTDLTWLAQFFKGLVPRTTGFNTTGLRLGRPEPA